jgi:hypothetical protein
MEKMLAAKLIVAHGLPNKQMNIWDQVREYL